MSILETDDLKAYYIVKDYLHKSDTFIHAVDEVSLSVNANEIFGITGESGCGKTTLIKVLYGFIDPPLVLAGGKVSYYEASGRVDLLALSKNSLRRMWWRVFSYIPQGSMSVLNPTIRIKNEFLHIIRSHNEEIAEKEVLELIEKHIQEVGLPSEVLDSYPHQLSGGMRQRAVIALSTILKPRIIFADEPTTALDVIVQRGIVQLLKRIQRETKSTLVLVTHDMSVQAQVTDRIAVMYAGNIIELAPTNLIFENPLHPYTSYLIKSLTRIGDKFRRPSISGKLPSLKSPPPGCRFHARCPLCNDPCKKETPSLVEMEPTHYVRCHRFER